MDVKEFLISELLSFENKTMLRRRRKYCLGNGVSDFSFEQARDVAFDDAFERIDLVRDIINVSCFLIYMKRRYEVVFRRKLINYDIRNRKMKNLSSVSMCDVNDANLLTLDRRLKDGVSQRLSLFFEYKNRIRNLGVLGNCPYENFHKLNSLTCYGSLENGLKDNLRREGVKVDWVHGEIYDGVLGKKKKLKEKERSLFVSHYKEIVNTGFDIVNDCLSSSCNSGSLGNDFMRLDLILNKLDVVGNVNFKGKTYNRNDLFCLYDDFQNDSRRDYGFFSEDKDLDENFAYYTVKGERCFVDKKCSLILSAINENRGRREVDMEDLTKSVL